MNFDFDEINSLSLTEYFKPMRISEEAKEQRAELGELILDVVLLFFSSVKVFKGKKYTKEYFIDVLEENLLDATVKVTGIDEYISKHIRKTAEDVVNTTFEKLKNANPINSNSPDKDDDALSFSTEFPHDEDSLSPLARTLYDNITALSGEALSQEGVNTNTDTDIDIDYTYWLSEKRAFFIAGNEANSILNYSDYSYAKQDGNTRKQWLTMGDEKVRTTHAEIDGWVIGIDDLFIIGDSAMRFPHDTYYGAKPKEYIGCRCSVRYF